MYSIEKNNGYLMVKFEENFDGNTIRTVIHHETMLKEYPYTDDIWLIGKHRVRICLSDLESLVQDFRCRCPHDAERKKTAIVVEPGLTSSILQILTEEARQRVPFEIRIFHTLDDAKRWLGVDEQKVA